MGTEEWISKVRGIIELPIPIMLTDKPCLVYEQHGTLYINPDQLKDLSEIKLTQVLVMEAIHIRLKGTTFRDTFTCRDKEMNNLIKRCQP